MSLLLNNTMCLCAWDSSGGPNKNKPSNKEIVDIAGKERDSLCHFCSSFSGTSPRHNSEQLQAP